MIATFTLLWAAGCKNLIGLEEHQFVAGDGGVAPADLKATCNQYCTDAVKNCTGNGVQAFQGNEVKDCQAICSFLPLGATNAPSGNSASCRARYAAQASGGERDATFCPAASPGGGSPGEAPSCGDNCEAYCGIYAKVCAGADSDCMAHCPGVPDRGAYNAGEDFNGFHDTIQCRLAHLNAAARYKADNDPANTAVHCGHSALKPSLLNNGLPCDLQPMEAPTCKDYCQLVKVGCKDQPQYDSDEQCMRVCERGFASAKGLPKGEVDRTEDTLNCRRWHAYFTFDDDPKVHCSHAGPGGAGHCGGPGVCPAYCSLLAGACKDRFKSDYPVADKCVTDCEALTSGKSEEQLRYNVEGEAVLTDTYQCRLRAVVKVFENMGAGSGMGMALCSKAFPKDKCTP